MTDEHEPIPPQEEEDDSFDEDVDPEETHFLGEKTKSTLLHVLESSANQDNEALNNESIPPNAPKAPIEEKSENSISDDKQVCSPRNQPTIAIESPSPITSPRNDEPAAESSLRVRLRKAHGSRPRRDVVSINLEAMSALAVADIKRFSLSSTAVLEVEGASL